MTTANASFYEMHKKWSMIKLYMENTLFPNFQCIEISIVFGNTTSIGKLTK
jgi:hypothetical protein